MKRLQLPKNKFARLGINIFIIVGWYLLLDKIIWLLIMRRGYDYLLKDWLGNDGYFLLLLIIFIVSSLLISNFIWFGRILPRPKITKSKD